jgi:putative ABC transport system substrate-binding protein
VTVLWSAPLTGPFFVWACPGLSSGVDLAIGVLPCADAFRSTERHEFVSLLGGSAAWPFTARAQQSTIPLIGFLHSASAAAFAAPLVAFRKGLSEAGYVEGQNVAIEYRWAEGQYDRLPVLAEELVRRQVAVIVAPSTAATLALKAATTTIPIVFAAAEDPVRFGLVASLARPGGNLTGINFFSSELVAKRLELLRELVPRAARVAVLIDPSIVGSSERAQKEVEAAARALGLQIRILNAINSREIDAAFAALVRERADALFVGPGGLFNARRVQLGTMAARHAVPMTSATREIAEAGGLMSYGPNLADAWRVVGVYAGRILKGAKPRELPVEQLSKFELIINAQTARMLNLEVPPTLLARADEVIE